MRVKGLFLAGLLAMISCFPAVSFADFVNDKYFIGTWTCDDGRKLNFDATYLKFADGIYSNAYYLVDTPKESLLIINWDENGNAFKYILSFYSIETNKDNTVLLTEMYSMSPYAGRLVFAEGNGSQQMLLFEKISTKLPATTTTTRRSVGLGLE